MAEAASIDIGADRMKMDTMRQPRVALLIPCYNEEAAIDQRSGAFSARSPRRRSSSTTTTLAIARSRSRGAAGAIVRHEARQGKGNVVRRMFADIEADIYVLVDGDATYCADPPRR